MTVDNESAGGRAEGTAAAHGEGRIESRYAGESPDGKAVYAYTLTNKNGMQARILTYGGIMTSLMVPDRQGCPEDVVLGYSKLEDYLRFGNKPYFGALIGRYANRIGGGTFELDGQTYRLSVNENGNTLHGGKRGFDKRVWQPKAMEGPCLSRLELRYASPNGEEGFPGNVTAVAAYTLTDDNELRIDYAATSDRRTALNLTQHNYYNLAGAGNGNVLDHLLTIYSACFTPVRPDLVPTGEVRSVACTPLDFRLPTPIGARIRCADPQLRFAGGYDINYLLCGGQSGLKPAASVYEPTSGRRMDVYTTQPALQFYSGQKLGELGKKGKFYGPFAGFALETQHPPDAPNHPCFPSTALNPGQVYRQTTIYRFSAC